MPFIVEPYILFKHGLRGSIVTYYVTYLKYVILLIAVGSLIQYGLMQFDINNNVLTLAIRLIIINIIAIVYGVPYGGEIHTLSPLGKKL